MSAAYATSGATPAVSVRTVAAPRNLPLLQASPQTAVHATELASFSRDLQQLVGLEDNWDSYGALAPKRPALEFAWRVASDLCDAGPAPQVFPTRRGGVQLEWHRPHTRLEWEIDPDGSTGVFVFDDETSGQAIDGELPSQLSELLVALAQVLVDR